MLRYAVVGSGAVGCFYGIRLAHAGADVQFLVRHGAQDVRAHGLELTSPEGDIHLDDVRVAPDWTALQPCDVLIVAVKATANSDVLAHLADHADRLLGPGSGILLVQNGIGVEPAYAAVAPGREVLAGLAFLCAQRTGPRSVAHLDFGALTIAAHAPDEAPVGITPLMRAIDSDLTAARTATTLDEDLVRARWRKLLWNVAFNPLSVILDATTDQLMADPDAVTLIRSVMGEVLTAAAAEGRTFPGDLVEDLLASTARMAPYATSMKLDADAGRPMEVEVMLAEPLRRAARAGVAMPSVAVLHRQLAFLDARIGREAPAAPDAPAAPS
ncbi:MAG: 2-dehydropantoate 2-reductase [Candidatus Nanopelagicales bacterium]|nr:2-dehydropantoate 2-reductase [Candidatus Nanopelagicales bacterium]